MKINRLVTIVPYIILFVFIFRFVLLKVPISGGDYITPTNTILNYWRNFSFSAWDGKVNLGWSTIALLSYAPYASLFGFMGSLIGGIMTERILWWGAFFLIGYFSVIHFVKQVLPDIPTWFITPLVFVFNTYIILILTGGQISGIGLSYAIAPLVFSQFYKLANGYHQKKAYTTNRFPTSLLAGLLLSIQMMFDLRMSYVTLILVGMYYIYSLACMIRIKRFNFISTFIYIWILPGFITMLLHLYWILPTIIFHSNPIQQLGAGYSSVSAVQFFSFAKLENTISLLHPNWPENIFGKVNFMKPEYLIIPILAYVPLIGYTKKGHYKKAIIFFSLVGILGSFLAKGASDPFGGIYTWCFTHIPGFIMFRDSTKFYLLVALSYSVLLPTALYTIAEFIVRSKVVKITVRQTLIVCTVIFVAFWLITIREAILQQMNGVVTSHATPQEYTRLQSTLEKDPRYSRVLWIPAREKFGYFAVNHPSMNASDIFHTSDPIKIVALLKNADTQNMLTDMNIGYIVIPDDVDHELFIRDRKFDYSQYKYLVTQLISLKNQYTMIGKIMVQKREVDESHIWIISDTKKPVQYHQVSPTQYEGKFYQDTDQALIFSEMYDPNWVLTIDGKMYRSVPYNRLLNEFRLSPNMGGSFQIQYLAQNTINIGLVISGASLLLVATYLLVEGMKGKL